MTTQHIAPDALADIVIPEGIATQVHLRRDEPALFIADNYRHTAHIQALVRDITGRLPDIPLRVVGLDEIHALNKGMPTDIRLEMTPPQLRVVDLFRQAAGRKASDIHLAIGEDGLTLVKFRIHGELVKVDSMSREEGEQLASTIMLSMCDVAESQFNSSRPQDGRIKAECLQGMKLFGARYSHTPTVYGIHAVMRLIKDDSDNPPSLPELGFLPEQQEALEEMINTPEGVMIISGPTGSGKSATLRTLANMYLSLHHQTKNLVTYEDPPEGRIIGAVQCPIIADKNKPDEVLRVWRQLLSNALRIDPDAILVQEMRDAFSANACVTNAMTGHLVLSTLHANDPINILERLVTLDVRPELLADPQLFIGLISQRLVQVLCPHCCQDWDAVQAALPPKERAMIATHCDTGRVRFRHAGGCEHCDAGVAGRQVVAEIIRPDARFMQRYRLEGKLAARSYWLQQPGSISRNRHVLKLINEGAVDPRAAQSICPLDEDQRLSTEEPAHEH